MEAGQRLTEKLPKGSGYREEQSGRFWQMGRLLGRKRISPFMSGLMVVELKTNWYMMEYRSSKDDYIYPKGAFLAISKTYTKITPTQLQMEPTLAHKIFANEGNTDMTHDRELSLDGEQDLYSKKVSTMAIPKVGQLILNGETSSSKIVTLSGCLSLPRFLFYPTDNELMEHYLKHKVLNMPIHDDAISEIDLYKWAPWDLPSQSPLKHKNLQWFFFNFHDRTHSRSHFNVNNQGIEGCWSSDIDLPVRNTSTDAILGMKKFFVFCLGKFLNGKKTYWIMHEYRLKEDDDQIVSTMAIPKVGQSILNGETSSSTIVTSSGCLSLTGFMFHPSDNELMEHYLKSKLLNLPIHDDAISEIDLYKWAPWDLPSQSPLKHENMQWFFFNFHDRTHSRSYFNVNNQGVEGYYSPGTDLPVRNTSTNAILGMKKFFNFRLGKFPNGKKTYWIMHEYRLKEDDDKIGSSTPFTTGSMAEVAYTHENVPVAWYTATVTEILSEKVFLVEHLSLKNEDGSLLRGTFSVQNIRPCPPSTREVRVFQLLDIVEEFYNGRWWQGVTAAVKDQSKYNVKLMLLEDEIVSSSTKLGVVYDWINEEWILASQDDSLESQINVESLHACSPLNKRKDPDPVATSTSNVDIFGLLPSFKKNKNDQGSRRLILRSRKGRTCETTEDSIKFSLLQDVLRLLLLF